jgi:3-hydroxybutyryl-CoA dehydrogenase
MGLGIAYVFAGAGRSVVVAEPDAGRRAALADALATQAAKGASLGRLTAAEADELPRRVSAVADVQDLPEGLDLVVESVPERPELKRAVLAAAEARRPALLATGTSSLSVDALAEGLDRPQDFLGMHFFNPVWSLQLVELVRGGTTSPAALARARELVALLGKQAIVVGDVPGFATTRLDMVNALEAIRMLESGVASADDIDTAMTVAYRHPVGPLRLSDLVGLDVRLDIARSLTAVHGDRFAPPRLLEEKVAAGQLGRKTGQGFFPW